MTLYCEMITFRLTCLRTCFALAIETGSGMLAKGTLEGPSLSRIPLKGVGSLLASSLQATPVQRQGSLGFTIKSQIFRLDLISYPQGL
ncbi:Uncharacterized protein FKW44_011188 [Caligus rogercresseyi]|uniref:Secreted protein n=1 Tax=Caligus rogercresseyi TaxID=217165 RepID=A0A7T8HHN2_CALRO|nr:Uncharacterized protein FKW44_011188 [Caligus rogercresseyi]